MLVRARAEIIEPPVANPREKPLNLYVVLYLSTADRTDNTVYSHMKQIYLKGSFVYIKMFLEII